MQNLKKQCYFSRRRKQIETRRHWRHCLRQTLPLQGPNRDGVLERAQEVLRDDGERSSAWTETWPRHDKFSGCRRQHWSTSANVKTRWNRKQSPDRWFWLEENVAGTRKSESSLVLGEQTLSLAFLLVILTLMIITLALFKLAAAIATLSERLGTIEELLERYALICLDPDMKYHGEDSLS